MAHYSQKTVIAYVRWTKAFVRFHGVIHPRLLGGAQVVEFLTWLATERRLAASTQNQALGALLFLYREVIQQPLTGLSRTVWAKIPTRVPVVLTPEEAESVVSELGGTNLLIGVLLYGAGLRLGEALTLRVKDLDFERREIVVRRGKGQKDRRVMLPDALRQARPIVDAAS
mgnify:CR=1 FL=1